MSSFSESIRSAWDPWQFIPLDYNVGMDLTAEQVLRGRADKAVLHWENAVGASRTVTYRELDHWSTIFARSLTHLGISREDRVVLRLPNIPEFYVAALGAAKNGSIFVPTSTQFRPAELEYRLRDCEAKAIVVTTGLLGAVEEVASRCPNLQRIIVVPYPEGAGGAAGFEDYASLIDGSLTGRHAWVPAATRHDDPAFIGYTSGTTGDPKGALHMQRYPRAYEGQGRFWHDYRDTDVVACPSELGWLLPLATTFLYALARGLTVVLYDAMGQSFSARQWFRLFEKYRINNFTATPTAYRLLLAEAELAKRFDLSAWRHGVSCGEPLPADALEKARGCFHMTLLDGLGTTECPVYCCNELDRHVRPGSCGRASAGVAVALLDEELRPVPEETDGIMCVRRDRHPGIMRGYWNKPELTAEVFRGEWYFTRDLVCRDRDGFHWFRTRADDMIKSGGYLISPFEIEQCVCRHPAVAEAAAVACGDTIRGNLVKAFVVLRGELPASAGLDAEIRNFVKERLAPYKCPREIEFVASLPRTTTGKLRRFELRSR